MRQELRLEHRLILTPQLRLNLELLQKPMLELAQMVREELETNPVLEEVEDPAAPEAECLEVEGQPVAETEPVAAPDEMRLEDQTADPETGSAPEGEELVAMSDKEQPELASLESQVAKREIQPEELLQDDGYVPPSGTYDRPSDEEGEVSEPPDEGTPSLAEALLPQLRARLDEKDAAIAEAVVDHLDENGFLFVAPEELAQQLDRPLEDVTRVLAVVQHLEGGGLGARDVREALLLQLEVMGYDRLSVEYRLVAECFDEMVKKQFPQIARRLGTTEERVREALASVAQLEPKPGRKFSGTNPGYVHPDFAVEWRGDEICFFSTDEWVPKLRLSAHYREVLRSPKDYPREKVEFARKKFQNAMMLLKGIESRRKTLSRVMRLIVERQREFFVTGRESLKPVTIKETGEALNIHPSTISRAVQNKYVQTQFGVFPMRFYFTSGTDGHARHSVKDRIKRMIEEEDKKSPLSDDAITSALAQEGMKMSRRVIAKYRAEMNIPGRNERRV
jgi:RNA polymerase sigma-54 factor